jgi:hypothetical protein
VYFRSTMIDGDPRRIDDGIHFVRDQVVPFIARIEGSLGVMMHVDRVSGRTVTTSAWGSAPAMHDSLDVLTAIRSQAARLLGGPAQVESWEVPEMHRVHRSAVGCGNRSTRIQVLPRDVDLLIDIYRTTAVPDLSLIPGFCGTALMVDRGTGTCVAWVEFEDRPALEDSRRQATEIRQVVLEKAHARAVEVLETEVAVADLHVPDEAGPS